jgi:hypothetical protein
VCVESGRPDDGPVRVYVTAESSCLVRRVRAVGSDNVESGWLARAEAGTPRVASPHTHIHKPGGNARVDSGTRRGDSKHER